MIRIIKQPFFTRWLATGLIGISALTAHANNPLVSHVYTADPSARVFNDRVYVITTHDPDGSTDYGELQDYFLWSTDDMVNWQDHGIIFGTQTHTTWAFGAYAPDLFERNGKYYLIFPNVTSGIGILEADHPEGPYVDIKGSAVISQQNTQNADVQWLFDPGVLVDDDNAVYVTFGGGGPGQARIVKLTDDLKGPDGPAVTVDAPNFFEASYIHKRNGVYYFTYSKDYTGGAPTIEYMTSNNPMSGYRHRGTVIPQPWDNYNGNNHHSFIDYKGKSYAFYHNQTVWSNGPGNGQGSIYQRSMNVDLLTYSGDVMNRITPTRNGPPQIQNFDPFRKVEAEIIDKQQGIETERNADGSMHVQMVNNSWYNVSGVDFGNGANLVQVEVAASTATTLEIRTTSANGALVGTIQVPATGGLNNFSTITASLNGVTGVQDLYFVAKGRLNFNWYQFTGEPQDCGTADGAPVCCNIMADINRDGWGEEWGTQCRVTENTEGYAPLNPANVVAAINVGSTSVGDYFDDIYYQPDAYSNGGQTNNTTDAVLDAQGSMVFNSERYGDVQYNIPVANGAYSVNLLFNEMYWTASGERVFDVSLEGESVITGLDLFQEVGHDAAYSQHFDAHVSDGVLDIALTTVIDNATLSGILVRTKAATSSSVPTSSSSQSSAPSSVISSSSIATSSSAANNPNSSASSTASTPVKVGALNIAELLTGLMVLWGAALLRSQTHRNTESRIKGKTVNR